LVLSLLFPSQFGPESQLSGVILSPVDATVKGGHHPELTLLNKTEGRIVLPDTCPMPPVEVYSVSEGGKLTQLTTEETAIPCTPLAEIAKDERLKIDLSPWKYSLFGEYGEYEVRLQVAPAEGEELETLTARLSIYEPGSITKLFRTFITKPFLNFLIFVASLLPDRNLGIAIIVLTLLVKLALFFPTQHAMEGQKKLQNLQPKLDEIKKKHKSNPEKMNKEIMKLWKENNVNPMQSCLPMLIQFPVLIGLFFVIRDGSILELSRHLLYAPYQDISWSFGTNFLGLNLLEPSKYIFPPLLVVMQFMQMKLTFAIAKKKTEKDGKEKKEKKAQASQQEMQQRMMLYGLPIMIGVFALQFPAAVSLYWAVSTLFAIAQQLVVNRKELV
jgi:YidC/Oxa1 family membrane protein insertase